MLYFKLVAILMHDITNNLAPQNILRLFYSTDQVHAYDTRSSSRGGKEINFSRLDKQYKSFQDLGPKYGIAYLLVLEISQNKALKRKYMTAYNYFKLSPLQTNDYLDLPTLLGQMQHIHNRP